MFVDEAVPAASAADIPEDSNLLPTAPTVLCNTFEPTLNLTDSPPTSSTTGMPTVTSLRPRSLQDF